MSKIREGATIKIRPSTRDRLKAAKRGGESYDETINRLLNVLKLMRRRKNEEKNKAYMREM